MNLESIAIPSQRVPPVAKDQSGSSKSIAAVLLFFAGLALLAVVITLTDDKLKSPEDVASSAEAAGHAVGTVIGMLIFPGVPGLFGLRAARNASRATRAAAVASGDPSYTWRLVGKHIFAADAAGVPHPELSFKISNKLRTMLVAVPRAEVVDGRGQY